MIRSGIRPWIGVVGVAPNLLGLSPLVRMLLAWGGLVNEIADLRSSAFRVG